MIEIKITAESVEELHAHLKNLLNGNSPRWLETHYTAETPEFTVTTTSDDKGTEQKETRTPKKRDKKSASEEIAASSDTDAKKAPVTPDVGIKTEDKKEITRESLRAKLQPVAAAGHRHKIFELVRTFNSAKGTPCENMTELLEKDFEACNALIDKTFGDLENKKEPVNPLT